MTLVRKYTKRPVSVEAMQIVDPTTSIYATRWMTLSGYPPLYGDATHPETLRYSHQVTGDNPRPDKGWYIEPAEGCLVIRTLEGDMRVAPGDWIIRGVAGEFYPCKPEIFAETYTEAEGSTPAKRAGQSMSEQITPELLRTRASAIDYRTAVLLHLAAARIEELTAEVEQLRSGEAVQG